MLDFTSALYLGFRHASSSLSPWRQLTTGVPAALAVPAEAMAVSEHLARLIGAPRATLAASTLHLFFDLVPLLSGPDTTIHVDDGAYPIARWGVERARCSGVPVQVFRHRDPDALLRQLRRDAARRRRPLVVADGYCPGCGDSPLNAYAALVDRFEGRLVLDDTQALGVLGEDADAEAPLGRGGGGSVRRHRLDGVPVVVGASLAKGFGAPVAVLAGDAETVARFEHCAQTRVHCSPPSTASIRAATLALELNRQAGDAIRSHLGTLVHTFRVALSRRDVRPRGGMFPVQTLGGDPGTPRLHTRLRELGVDTVLHRGHHREPVLSFLITADHQPQHIEAAVAALEQAVVTGRAKAISA